MALSVPLRMPDARASSPELIPTLNRHGDMTLKLDSVSQAFVDFACQCDGVPEGPVLEIGAAYGLAALPAITNGCTRYIANDMCEDHLQILNDR